MTIRAPPLRRRWCVCLALALETISLMFGPIKDIAIWQYPTTLFKPSLSYSSQILDEVFLTKVDNFTVVSDLGLDTIAIEFPNLQLGADLAAFMGYDYNAENLWSMALRAPASTTTTTLTTVSRQLMDKLTTIMTSSDKTTERQRFLTACSKELVRRRTGETECWFSDHRAASNVREFVWHLLNQLNAHPPGVVFGTIPENARSGDNISTLVQTPDSSSSRTFSVYYGGESYGFGDAHTQSSVARFLSTPLIPAVCNSVEAYLCLGDMDLDDVFASVVADDPTSPLDQYIKRQRTSDPEFLSKLLLPEFASGLQQCRQQSSLTDRMTWLVEQGELQNIWPRITFDSIAEVLADALHNAELTTEEEQGQVLASKFEYPGTPYLYADKRAKWNILGNKALTVNSTKKIVFSAYVAPKTYPWRRQMLMDWYYHAIDRTTTSPDSDYAMHNQSEAVYSNANKDALVSHRVKRYSFGPMLAFSGCHPLKTDCTTLVDLNNASRWNATTFGNWTDVQMPSLPLPNDQVYTDVSSFDELILAVRSSISYPAIAVDMDNSFARPRAESTYDRNYVMADVAGLMDGALPFLTTMARQVGQLEPWISPRTAKAFYLQKFLSPKYNVLSVGRVLFAKSRQLIVPFVPYPREYGADPKTTLVLGAHDLACAWDRTHQTQFMGLRVRDHNGQCGPGKGPVIADRGLYDLLLDFFADPTLSGDQIVAKILDTLDRWQLATNTSLDRVPFQIVVASKYPMHHLSTGFFHRLQTWRYYPHFFLRGDTKHLPSNAYHVTMPSGLKYATQGFYMDASMEGAYKMLTFVAIFTSILTALVTIATVVVPTIVSIIRAANLELTKHDMKALMSMDLACAAYSSSIMLPFNILSGLIPVMEILTHMSPLSGLQQLRSVIAVVLCSWRYGVGVLQLLSSMTLPGRFSWLLAGVVASVFYGTTYAGLGEGLEIYSRALLITFVNYVICCALAFPVLRWYQTHYTSQVTNTTLNTVCNRNALTVGHTGHVAHHAQKGERAQLGLSIVHALEAAARFKVGIWIDFTKQIVVPFRTLHQVSGGGSVSVVGPSESVGPEHSPLAIT